MTGHLFDVARRVERPLAYRAASIDGDWLLLDYTALVTDDLGRPLGRTERRAAVALADLRRSALPVERFPVVHLAEDAPLRGRRVMLVTPGAPRPPPPFLEIAEGQDGRQTSFVLRGDADDVGRFYSGALAERHTAAWVYPLLPFAAAVDAVADPVLLLFAPAVILLGD